MENLEKLKIAYPNVTEEEWKDYETYQKEAMDFDNVMVDGRIMPSRASLFILIGLESKLKKDYKDDEERQGSLNIKQMLISAMYQPIFDVLKKSVESGKATFDDYRSALIREGEDLAKEFRRSEDGE